MVIDINNPTILLRSAKRPYSLSPSMARKTVVLNCVGNIVFLRYVYYYGIV